VTGGRINRFNIVKQSKDYDPDGAYVRHWLPELENVPANKVHEPWLLSRDEQQRCGLTIGVDYPNPPKSQWAGFGDGGGKGKGGGGRGGRNVQSTPAQAAAMARGQGARGRGGGKGGGGRKRVQHDYM
jgi:deoxyribodipyrimidine photo-lyase